MKTIQKIINSLFKKKSTGCSSNTGNKLVKSFIQVGDVVELIHFGKNVICKVEEMEVIPDHPYSRPIGIVIRLKLSWTKHAGTIQCTSDQFQYVRHISHAK